MSQRGGADVTRFLDVGIAVVVLAGIAAIVILAAGIPATEMQNPGASPGVHWLCRVGPCFRPCSASTA